MVWTVRSGHVPHLIIAGVPSARPVPEADCVLDEADRRDKRAEQAVGGRGRGSGGRLSSFMTTRSPILSGHVAAEPTTMLLEVTVEGGLPISCPKRAPSSGPRRSSVAQAGYSKWLVTSIFVTPSQVAAAADPPLQAGVVGFESHRLHGQECWSESVWHSIVSAPAVRSVRE